MEILVLNGSPKGKNSTTYQTLRYLEAKYPQYSFDVAHVGQTIKSLERDSSKVMEKIEKADLVIFCYPVYTFIAPYQMHRFIELMKEVGVKGKYATQITTSKHFYDTTAHRFIKENCLDMGFKYIEGLSEDMEDLLSVKGQKEAEMFFEKVIFDINNDLYCRERVYQSTVSFSGFETKLPYVEKSDDYSVAVVTNCGEEDSTLREMIKGFCNVVPYTVKVVNIRDFEFKGGCIGCFNCAFDGTCIYKDGFEGLLRNEIQGTDAIINAFTIENHYTHSSFKCYDDRQFCNGHRPVSMGKQVGYIINGEYSKEQNVRTIVEARSDVSGTFLTGVATSENDTDRALEDLAISLGYSLEHAVTRPQSFYGVGGLKVFRDLIFVMQGLMKEDHKFYKEHGIYDFPQKKKLQIAQMYLVGAAMEVPAIKKKMRGKLTKYMIAPYEKVIDNVK